MRFKVLICVWIFSALLAVAQISREDLRERISERLIENLEDESDYLDLLEQALMYLDDPMDINQADAAALSRLGFLSPAQITDILEHRKRFGHFLDVYELQVVQSLDFETLQMLRYMIRVGSPVLRGRDIKKLISEADAEILGGLSFTHPWARGYFTGGDSGSAAFPGSPYRRLIRIRAVNGRRFSFGVNMESDAGEVFGWNQNTRGFDFYSGHFMLADIGRMKQMIVGDFQADFGQGLCLGTGFNIGKSALVLRTKKSFQGIRPYRALNESQFLRGAAVQINLGKAELSIFQSMRSLDANVTLPDTLDTEEDQAAFRSVQISGLHRTPAELAVKNALSSQGTGAHLGWKYGNQRIGTTLFYQQFGSLWQSGDAPYQQFSFEGNRFLRMGIDWDLYWKNLNVYGEFCRSEQGVYALNSGLLASLGKRLDLSVLYRNYHRQFNPFLANAFSERSNPSNENGLYTGIHFQYNRKTYVSAYADHYRFPWLSFQRDAPARGRDLLLEWGHAFTKKNKIYVRWRSERREENSGLELPVMLLHADQRSSIRFNFDHASEGFSFQTRAEWSRYEAADEITHGALIYQDIKWKKFPAPVDLLLRTAWFNTDDWDSRIYAYERDVLYQFSIPVFSGSGLRTMLFLHASLNKNSDLWFKWSTTLYQDITSIGSGTASLPGNRRTDVRIQYRYSF